MKFTMASQAGNSSNFEVVAKRELGPNVGQDPEIGKLKPGMFWRRCRCIRQRKNRPKSIRCQQNTWI